VRSNYSTQRTKGLTACHSWPTRRIAWRCSYTFRAQSYELLA
jgi:hypothetical protein